MPGPWQEEFLKQHKNDLRIANVILRRVLKSRECSEGILKELGDYMRRWFGPLLVKKGYSSSFVKILSIEELYNFLEKGVLPKKADLVRRAKGFVYIQGKIFLTTNPISFLAKRKVTVKEDIPVTGIREFNGNVAFAGPVVQGRVCLVFNSDETKKIKPGDILVTQMTAPDYLAAMKKAAAIVTDEGGITCHAAIVARELRKPTIIGTKVATKVLKDGDIIEVNTTTGTITKCLK